tara:strand:+ start:156 stop:821 length:666 start_codon:yes stop_codon:yes gene_type:complete
MKKDKEPSRILSHLIKGAVAISAFQFFMTGAGYDQICVAESEDTVSCVQTSVMEKYLASAGVSGIAFPETEFSLGEGESAALLICQGGDFYPIGLEEERKSDETDGSTSYSVDYVPSPCVPPKKPKNVSRYYGPADAPGGNYCNGRTSINNCKDCCLTVGLAQAGVVAASGKLYRDTKPSPRGLIADVVIESAAYGLIYANRYRCNDNCEIGYDAEEKVMK